MGKVLTIDEMLDIATGLPGDTGAGFVRSIEAVATALAKYIAESLEIECGDATYEGAAFAGTCAVFSPASEGQEMPAELEGFDEGGDWE